LCLDFEALEHSPFDLRDVKTESLFKYEIIKKENLSGFRWLSNRRLGEEKKQVRNLKLKIGNNKDFVDLEFIFKKLEPTCTLKVHWLNENGSKFLVFMKQLSKEVNLRCNSLRLRVSGDIKEVDYESFNLIRVRKSKQLWLDRGNYLSLNKA
jgi:hypothetical protein